ncbi:hypothetical protein COCNU_scaffold017031G000010 [Cocos nucifera]|nr:hypothetical protein [Cocos nucifera]
MIGHGWFPSDAGTISRSLVVVVAILWGEAASAGTMMSGDPGSYNAIALYWGFVEEL